MLQVKGYEYYLPVYRDRRRWSDRFVESDQPLFPGYLFCRFDVGQRLAINTTPGVVSIVGFGLGPACIPDAEIKAVQMVLLRGCKPQPHSAIQQGQRVRVHHGSLNGLDGILIKTKNDWRIVVSVTILQRSVSIEIDRECVSAVH
jgi:transcription antitermination factor NusG